MVTRWIPDPRCLSGMNRAPQGRYVDYDDYMALLMALQVKEEQVGDLMRQAVRFASALRNDRMDQWCELMTLDPDAPATVDVVAKQDADFRAATAFLNSPEVQAWRKE